MTMRDRALRFVETQIRKTRIAIGHAEQKPNAYDEVDSLYDRLEVLEWISQLVLGAKEEA